MMGYLSLSGLGYGVCRFLEDHVSVDAGRTFYNSFDRRILKPLRYFRSWRLWLARPQDRQYLAGAWRLREDVNAYLQAKFGYKEWDVCRGGMDHVIIGFLPITRDGKGRKVFHVTKIVYDMLAVRGRVPMDLSRLETRG